ncbi:hypothetical protein B0H16DRAFT_1833849 [Mycena metata]|uniref:Uncharacterized protein n=1 Tax=Mycena metata TaxID=1033252 RepID=A0AAD7J1C9_9AGAR|nr:hypothetical protein B0H16DRAFT_1833849 [Mycena metata]
MTREIGEDSLHINLKSGRQIAPFLPMANVPAAPGATAAAFIAAQESLQAAENQASDTSSLFASDPTDAHLAAAHTAALEHVDATRAVRDAASGPAYAAARALVDGILSHYIEFKSSIFGTVPTTLYNAFLSTSFSSLAQELEDAAAQSSIIVDFRRQWRRFHGLPEMPHGRAQFLVAIRLSTFGAAAAYFVDQLHVSDDDLKALVAVWRAEHEPSTSPIVATTTSSGTASSAPGPVPLPTPAKPAPTDRRAAHSRTPTPAPGEKDILLQVLLPCSSAVYASNGLRRMQRSIDEYTDEYTGLELQAFQRIVCAPTVDELFSKEKDILLQVLLPCSFAVYANDLVSRAQADAGIPETKLLQSAVPNFDFLGNPKPGLTGWLFFWRISIDMAAI